VSCRFTTGAIRVEDATHVVLPRIGRLHTYEPATTLLDKVEAGHARILAATASFDGRRWYCAFTAETGRDPARPAHAGADRAHPVVGVDAGVRDLLVAAAPDGTEVARVPAPRSLAAAQARLRACSADRPARTARTGVPGGAARSGGGAPPGGSRGSTPGQRTCAATRCTRPPAASPAGTRSSSSKTSR
jgi:hypothetical protein